MKIKEGFTISPYIHGGFIENFGKVIYDGIWVGKDSEIPNVDGIRKDVIEGIKEAGLTMCRWPGGCCAEKYHWKDGIGNVRYPREFPWKESKPKLYEMYFGTDEFLKLCELTGMEPMLVANVTSGSPEEFADWEEYCNSDERTKYGSMRAKNGHPKPYNVKFWGIGNTDENTWKAAYNSLPYSMSYCRFITAIDADRLNKLKIVGLGLSIRHNIKGWAESYLDYVTAKGTLKGPDMLSVHHYLGGNKDGNCGDAINFTDDEYYYLLNSLSKYQEDIDYHRNLIKEHTNCNYKTTVSFDEWGVWESCATIQKDQRQPQTLRAAIFAGLAMHIFYRNCDIVETAMETQITNLLQSLFETDGEKFYKTATFYVMKLFKEHNGNKLLENEVKAQGGKTDVVSSLNEKGEMVITIVNSDLYEGAKITLPTDFSQRKVILSDEIYADDVRISNDYDNPFYITDKPFSANSKTFTVKPHSIVRIKLK